MQKWERDWDRLAARLGQEHDLQELLKQLPAKRDAHSATQQFARLAQRWAANLQLAAAALGSRLHAERTRPLVKRLRHHARGAGMK